MRKFKITVDGIQYDVLVEEVTGEENESSADTENEDKNDKKRKKRK